MAILIFVGLVDECLVVDASVMGIGLMTLFLYGFGCLCVRCCWIVLVFWLMVFVVLVVVVRSVGLDFNDNLMLFGSDS